MPPFSRFRSAQILQNYPAENIDSILEGSNDLWKFDREVVLKLNDGVSLRSALLSTPPPPNIIYAFGHKKGILIDPQDKIVNGAKHAGEKVGSAVGHAAGLVGKWGGKFLNDVRTTANEQQENLKEQAEMRRAMQKKQVSKSGICYNATASEALTCR